MSTKPENIDISKLDWRGQRAVKDIVESFVLNLREIDKYKEMSSNQLKLQQYKGYPKLNFYPSDLPKTTDLDALQTKVDAWFKECSAIKITNADVSANNQKVYNYIISIFNLVGIQLDHPDPKSRKSFPPTVRKDFVQEIAKECCQYDINGDFERSYKNIIQEINKERIKRETAKRLAEQEAERAKKQKEMESFKLQMIQKYKIDISQGMPDNNTILEAITYSNKYLRLADAMLKTRGDWSDGCELVQCALAEFTTENQFDIKINNELVRLVEDWEGDGRVFRDCEYNYDFLFNFIKDQDAALMEDYKKMKDLV